VIWSEIKCAERSPKETNIWSFSYHEIYFVMMLLCFCLYFLENRYVLLHLHILSFALAIYSYIVCIRDFSIEWERKQIKKKNKLRVWALMALLCKGLSYSKDKWSKKIILMMLITLFRSKRVEYIYVCSYCNIIVFCSYPNSKLIHVSRMGTSVRFAIIKAPMASSSIERMLSI